MEANVCDTNHLDTDVLLPPRKRLLAGLKKQNFDGNSHKASDTSVAANEFDSRLKAFLKSHLNKPNVSTDEIIEASRSVALGAVKQAEAARAAAEEKAARAAKAVATAKSAIELVANASEEAGYKGGLSKKNKIKKHLPVQMLYNNHKVIKNCKTDEELAFRLHQAINSSPRILKNSSAPDSWSRKHKRLKTSSSVERGRIYSGRVVPKGSQLFVENGNGIASDFDSDGLNQEEECMDKIDESTSKLEKADHLKMMPNGEAETVNSEEKTEQELEDDCSIRLKRGKMKLKKLPLSICNFRDQATPQEMLKSSSSPLTGEKNVGTSSLAAEHVFPLRPSGDGVLPVEKSSMWKCQAFKAPQCVKQSKVMQS